MKQSLINISLKKALVANAIFSFMSGAFMIFKSRCLSNVFEADNVTIFKIIGTALIYFSLTILYEINKQRKWAVQWIIIQDYIWVVASAILILFRPFGITLEGNVIIGLIASLVLILGLWQKKGLKMKYR